MSDLDELYNNALEEGSEGLTKMQAYNVLMEYGKAPTPIEIADFWIQKGKSDTDTVNRDEVEELSEKLGDPVAALRSAFSVFDKDGNGTIDREELREILKMTDVSEAGIHLDDDFLDQTLKYGDTDNDKNLSIDELIKMITDGII